MLDLDWQSIEYIEWQLIGANHWIFGLKTRGVVRTRLAEVNFTYGWIWTVHVGKTIHQGAEGSLNRALEHAEEIMFAEYRKMREAKDA